MSKNNIYDARETDSPTPPPPQHGLANHVVNNVDYAREELKEKNLFSEENHVPGKAEGSLTR